MQLSLDVRATAGEHLALGRALAPLRDEGVLILASGNLTHDLRDAFARLRRGDPTTPGLGRALRRGRRAARSRRATRRGSSRALETPDGRRAHPTAEHWLPILYAAGAADARDAVRFPITGFDLGSLSMRAVLFG